MKEEEGGTKGRGMQCRSNVRVDQMSALLRGVRSDKTYVYGVSSILGGSHWSKRACPVVRITLREQTHSLSVVRRLRVT